MNDLITPLARNILAYGYSPMFEVQWIPVCETGGLCYSLNYYKMLQKKHPDTDIVKSFEIRTYKATNWFSIFPKRHADTSKCDLKYLYCPGCFRPIYVADSIRLNYLLGHKEPKKVIKKLDLEGFDDFL